MIYVVFALMALGMVAVSQWEFVFVDEDGNENDYTSDIAGIIVLIGAVLLMLA